MMSPACYATSMANLLVLHNCCQQVFTFLWSKTNFPDVASGVQYMQHVPFCLGHHVIVNMYLATGYL